MKVVFMRRKLHLCAHLTVKDLAQPMFVCADLAKSQDFPHFHLYLSSDTVVLGWVIKLLACRPTVSSQITLRRS